MKNFGEFFNNQIENASSIILSHTQSLTEEKLAKVVELIREHNPHAVLITTDWDKLDGKQILAAMERRDTIEETLAHMEHEHHEHHHHHHDHDEHCGCGCHDHDHHHHHADEVFTSWGVETAKKFDKAQIAHALHQLLIQGTGTFCLKLSHVDSLLVL